MKIQRSNTAPARQNIKWEEKWKGEDQGLIACWEQGRKQSLENPEIAAKARNGQLVILPWKGGVKKLIKGTQKYGTLSYLAMWQGLRGENLNVDTSEEVALTCTATGMTVVFTSDQAKYTEA